MPARPTWVSDWEQIADALRTSKRPFVDRAMVEQLLGVGRRRAQQLLAPCVSDRVGANGLAEREVFLERLQQVMQGEEARGERQRRQRVALVLNRLRHERITQPQLPVEAPIAMVNQVFESLPAGVQLKPGQITLNFQEPQEALEKLLALALAISNDFDQFERLTKPESDSVDTVNTNPGLTKI